jgi:hypothetical protein
VSTQYNGRTLFKNESIVTIDPAASNPNDRLCVDGP